jgi:hypothetical protein
MENRIMDYSTYYLEALKEIRLAHDALVKRDFAIAHDHCLNAQAEIRLLSTSVKSWIPVEE